MSDKRGITAEDLYRFVWTSDPSVSPNGERVAYVSKSVNKERDGYSSHIRMVELGSHEDISFTSGEQDRQPIWSPDGGKLAFIRNHQDKPQVWVIPANGGEAQIVTHAEHGVSGFAWSPDSSQLLFRTQVEPQSGAETDSNESKEARKETADSKKPLEEEIIDRIRYKADGTGRWNGRRSHLYIQQLGSNAASAPLTGGDYDIGDFCWSPDGENIAFVAKIPEDDSDLDLSLITDVYVINASGENRRKLTSSDWSVYAVSYSPDGEKLAIFGSDRSHHNATQVNLFIRPVQDGEWLSVTKAYDIQLSNSMVTDMRSGTRSNGPVFSQDGQSVYSLVSREGGVHLAKIASDGSGYEWISQGQRDIYQFEKFADEKFILAAADPAQPGDLFLLDTESQLESRLTQNNEVFLEEIELIQPEEFYYKASDGQPIQGWVLKPAGTPSGTKIPTVLEIHGGPHAMYGFTFMLEFQLLAARGYAVIYTNPRGGHGYSQEFVNAVRGDYGGRDYADLMEAVDYALTKYDFVDESQLFVTGGSYGGFMTNWIVGHTNRFKAAVTQRSISNWISFYGVSDIGFFFTEDQIGGDVWKNTELLWKHSPLAYVEQVETPLLILHGEEDHRCPIEQAEQLFIALKRLGKKTQFIRFPKSSHELSRGGHPGLRVNRLNHIVRWFDEHK